MQEGSKEARQAFLGHNLMENRNSLLVGFTVSPATGTAEREVVPGLTRLPMETVPVHQLLEGAFGVELCCDDRLPNMPYAP